MPSSDAQIESLDVLAGVQPSTDETPFTTPHYTDMIGARFYNGKPQKKGGFKSSAYYNNGSVIGTPRTMYTTVINSKVYTLISTEKALYSLLGNQLINITPLSTTSNAIGNVMTTDYATIVNNNYLVYSEDGTQTAWGKNNTTVTISGTSPIGTATANKVTEDGTTNQHDLYQIVTAPTNANYTFSVYVKSVSYQNIKLIVWDETSNSNRIGAIFNVATGSVLYTGAGGTGSLFGATIDASGSGFYRCSLRGMPSTASNTSIRCFILLCQDTDTNPISVTSYLGNGTNNQLIWGAQFEQGVMLNNYAMTTSARGNPIYTTSGSSTIFVYDATASNYRNGDSVTLSGATTTNGISNTLINGSQVIRSLSTNPSGYTITVGGTATGTGAGGGNSVVRSSGLVHVPVTNTLREGDRVKISGATAFGGITTGNINTEFIVRNVTASNFDVFTSGTATSSATGGGAGAVYYPPIADGTADVTSGSGYGVGLYGTGLYGVSGTSSAVKYPRIWQFDKYGGYILMTPGGQTGLYQWDGNTAVAPVLVSGAPTAINGMFVSDSIAVVYGVNGVENSIYTSDQNNLTQWTGTANNQVYQDTIEEAERFITRLNVNGVNLLFTLNQVFTFRYIGLPNVWEIKLLTNKCGIVGPNAGVVVDGTGYWMDDLNFYEYSGGDVEIIPSNSMPRSTCLQYFTGNNNTGQIYKAFAWYNAKFEEVTWHYPSSSSNEPNYVVAHNKTDRTWHIDQISRTAAEVPYAAFGYPRLLNSTGTLYLHEYGYNADGSALYWMVKTNLASGGKYEALLSAFIPDSLQTGTAQTKLTVQQWPKSPTTMTSISYDISITALRQEITQRGRFWQYTFSGQVVDQFWRLGTWQEELQQSGDGR